MFRIMTIGFLLPLFCLISGTVNIQTDTIKSGIISEQPPFFTIDNYWVDSVLNNMSLDEKIGQLLMYPAYSNRDESHTNEIKKLIKDYHIGGLIFMQGTPEKQAKLINEYQNIAKVPLLIAMDAEWSVSMRLRNTVLYPRQMMLGAIQDNQLIYEMGQEFARQLKRVGAHVNFAPVIDVNNNPMNPVINSRSFGEDIYQVSEKSYYYMKGMQDNGVLATGKHFPGHGDTDTDSHYSLPLINHTRDRLDSLELEPFRYLIDKGLGAIMTAHLFVPSIDSTENMPTSLSQKAVTGILKAEMGFNGLIFTDALNMGGVTDHFEPGEADVLALIAGNDVLLFPNNPKKVVKEIKKAIENGKITEQEIESRARKILQAKYWAGLNVVPEVPIENIVEDLNNTSALFMQQRLIENAITLVKNENDIVPIKGLDTLKIATLSFGNREVSSFQQRIDYYAKPNHYIYSTDVNKHGRLGLIKKLSDYDVIIISIHNTNRSPASKFGISQSTINFIDDLAGKTNIILNVFANPYSLDYFKNADKIQSVIVSYNDWQLTNDLTAQLVFGGIPARGKLPVSANEYFQAGMGVETEKIRLKYSNFPEEAGVNSSMMYKIDSLINDGLYQKAYPGAVVMAARNGIVFYNNTVGHHTEIKDHKLQNLDIFDLASLTKVLATTASFMRLYEEGKISLDDRISKYLPALGDTDKRNITFRDALSHQAGLVAWIPFYLQTIKDETIFGSIYSTELMELFNIEVADNMFILDSYIDSIYNQIYSSRFNNRKRYVYSDVGFYFIKDAIETITGKGINDYVVENFYNSLGAWSLRYNPLRYFDRKNIVPTEHDKKWRRQLLHGHVHDQGAAMLGGVAGHAGLFGNANDVMKMMQIFINLGEYGGEKYFEEETVRLFTDYNDRNFSRRSPGFDKPNPNNRDNGIGGDYSTESAYGHLGFTGTMVWADPEYDLVFVFLSNRIHPCSDNRKLQRLRVRGNILDVLYESIIKNNKKDELYEEEA